MRIEPTHSEHTEPCAQLADHEIGLRVPAGSKAGVPFGFAAYLWRGFAMYSAPSASGVPYLTHSPGSVSRARA